MSAYDRTVALLPNDMTLRDIAAIKAMQAFLGDARCDGPEELPELMRIVARMSYSMADAMLEAREVSA